MEAVSKNELGGRFNEANEGHSANNWFYYDVLIERFFANWYLLIPCGILIGLFYKDKVFVKFSALLSICFVVFFIVISFSKTKLDWYSTPLFPFAALIVATFIYFIFNFIQENNQLKKTLKVNILPFIFLFLLFINPYSKIVNETCPPKEDPAFLEWHEMAYFLKNAISDDGYDLQNHFYLNDEYNPQNDFYLEILKIKGVNINEKDYKKLAGGDNVFTNENTIKDYIKNNYDVTEVFTKGKISIYKIKGDKI